MNMKDLTILLRMIPIFLLTSINVQALDESSISAFSDTEILIELALKDDLQFVEHAGNKVKESEAVLQKARDELTEAEGNPDITDEERAEIELSVSEAEQNLVQARIDLASSEDKLNQEREIVRRQAERVLTEEQIENLNRAFRDARSNNLVLSLDSDDLQLIIDGQYNLQQINMLAKSIESEAKFMGLSARFEEKADIRNNDKMHEQAVIMETRARFESNKFENKVEKFGSQEDLLAPERPVARQVLREIARENAKETVRDSAKEAVKNSVKDNVREDVRDITREIMKEERKSTIKTKSNLNGMIKIDGL